MTKLAINGGTKIRTTLFPNQCNIGEEELKAASEVIKSGMLSGYRGNLQKYKGGEKVQEFEKAWCEKFNNRYAIACNSCTSALIIALGAIGIRPGDEVIVTPYSMTCSATAPLAWGAIPVFADVDEYFNLDPNDVEKKITDKTKAIIAVDLFGHPFNFAWMNKIKEEHGLFLIEDAAQAPGAFISSGYYKDRYAGSLGDISCFSFTQGKHMTAGEGGLLNTNDYELAEKCQLIMNHAESVVNDKWDNTAVWFNDDSRKLFGFNMRMTEIQAAILLEQLKKFESLLRTRINNAIYLLNELKHFPFIDNPYGWTFASHSLYCQPFLYNQEEAEGIHRNIFIDAVKAELTPMAGREDEGVRISNGYIKPIYRMPFFKDRLYDAGEQPKYYPIDPDEFPNVEKYWQNELFLHLYLAHPTTTADLDDIIAAFHKVWYYRSELK